MKDTNGRFVAGGYFDGPMFQASDEHLKHNNNEVVMQPEQLSWIDLSTSLDSVSMPNHEELFKQCCAAFAVPEHLVMNLRDKPFQHDDL